MMCISNTIFCQADKYKTTWMHPRSKQWHMIDFVTITWKDIQDVQITNIMWGAECWTDYRLVRSILKLCIASTQCKCPKLIRPSFNMARLRHPYHYNRVQETHLTISSRPVHTMLKTALRNGSSLRRSSLTQK